MGSPVPCAARSLSAGACWYGSFLLTAPVVWRTGFGQSHAFADRYLRPQLERAISYADTSVSMERRLELHLEGDAVTIPVDALLQFAKELRHAIEYQGATEVPKIRLEYFGPGGSKSLKLVVDDDAEGATEVVIGSFWSAAAENNARALRPQAAFTVRKAVAALLSSLPRTRVSVGSKQDDRGISPINDRFMSVLEERGRPKFLSQELMQRFVATGVLFEINMVRRRFRIRPRELSVVKLTFPPHLKDRLDKCRWKRTKVIATPDLEDPTVLEMISIEKAKPSDEEGFALQETEPVRHRYLRTLTALTEDKSLRKAGWNGYGAPPLSGDAVLRARRWLLMARAYAAWDGEQMEPPASVPTNTGGVQFEWRRGANLAELEFDDSGPIRSLIMKGDSAVEGARSFQSAMSLVRAFLQES